MQKKCLVISWYFPPINSSEGICTYKLLKNSKHQYDVFTQNKDLDWTYGSNADFEVPDNINIINSVAENKEKWIKEGYNYFLKNRNKYDTIMSRSNEPEAHDIALKIKNKYPEIKWIASFGDPLGTNPYNNIYLKKSPYSLRGKDMLNQSLINIFSPKRILKNIWWNYKTKKYLIKNTRYYKNMSTEYNTIIHADKIIFNNSYQMEHMLSNKNYTKDIYEKSYIIPHSYDLSFYKSKDINNTILQTNKIKMTYLGHFDQDRTPIQLLKAIKLLKEKQPKLYKKFQLDIYGNMSDNDKLYILNNKLFDVITFNNPVDYFTSLDIMSNSNVLLCVDANLAKYISSNIFYAAKIADYLGSGKPIFCVTMQSGISSEIVRNAGGIVSSYSENEIYMYLVSIIENKCSFNLNHKYIEKFNIKNIINEFDNIIKKERSVKK